MAHCAALSAQRPRHAGQRPCGRWSEHGRSSEHGFTLVELMVVMAVMALMAGAVVLTIGSNRGDLSETTSRFASRIAAARDEAIVGGRPVAVWISPSGYGFERYGDGRWQAFEQKPFEAHDWGKGLSATSGEGRSRIAFDTVGLPDSGWVVSISDGDRRASVGLASNGDVAVE
ncbi:type II secretion system protein GspH [Sphingorhabdus soli]|uniref:Type II secretion system protein H n=1 Tax=Flavisphingopyxis soli TaxID=2601267 RepID=A0A5C6UM62_9SPHN|nr:GspH/FimT family pseudopilin [Sphingorhabdus soli]TXC74332.1 type II secretion system protein GspH [Sphingorhabdus soli]